ncbi:MAG: hypothetical protein OCD00_14910 [Colwellia sp.]
MIVWKGWGLLAFAIPLICALLMQLGVNMAFGEGFYKTGSWPLPVALLLSSVLVFVAGYKLNNNEGRVLFDPQTNEKVLLKTTHSLFWIPIQYWSAIIVFLSIMLYLSNVGVI